MVPLQAPGVKHLGGTRPKLRVATPCYSRISKRRREFILSSKPEPLKHLREIDQKVWQQYQSHLERVTPLDRAEFYARQMEARGVKSPWILEKLLDEPFGRVWRALKLLQLPEPIRLFLKEQRQPGYLRYFTERKLLGLIRLGDTRTAWRRFREMIGEAEREAGIWRMRDRGEGSVP